VLDSEYINRSLKQKELFSTEHGAVSIAYLFNGAQA